MDTYLLVVVRVSGVSAPCANTDVGPSIGKSPNKLLQVGKSLWRIHTYDIARVVKVDAILQTVLGSLVGFVPRTVQILHKGGITLARGRLADLLDSHVTAGSDNVAEIEKVIACVA